ncbi:MAG: hypothetical protein ACRYHB_01030 [Janthinobacterium lividum]
MKFIQTRFRTLALLTPVAAMSLTAQMHRVATPDQVTRAVGVYEFVGDVQHPKAARLIPISLFISGHFEDAAVYLARPIPFALDTGLRYELQRAGVRQNFFDVVASRHFTSRVAAATTPFDDGWFGYGRVAPLPVPKVAKVRPNCGNARVVQEPDNTKKDDGKPHFGTKPAAHSTKPAADDAKPQATGRARRDAAPDPCRDEDEEKTEHISLADDRKKDDAPDPERPTLHRSPATSANNTGADGKPDKKAPKPPPATITANGGPADDPDRPTIRHRASDENDPNALPPDPIDLASRERSPATAKGATDDSAASAVPMTANDTVAEGATITAGNTTGGAPVLRRGRLSKPSDEPAAAATPAATAIAIAPASAVAAGTSLPAPLDTLVAVSDAKERVPHDFTYHFTSPTERAAALGTLQSMALAVLANPALATDAPDGVSATPASAASSVAPHVAATRSVARPGTKSATAAKPRAHIYKQTASAAPALKEEELSAFQLYFSAPVTYAYTAHMPATASTPERFVTVIAQTDADGKLVPAMRSVTDATHLDRTPRYRLIDVVDADGTNRASLLMELRAQHSRQFALYRLLGNRPDQIFITGTTLL